MVKDSRPRRGSMAFYPRVRARSIIPRIRSWPKLELKEPKLLAFAGYKVGMLHVVMIEDRVGSPLYGREVVKAATVIETPPLLIVGLRAYEKTPYGLRTIGEAWIENPPKDLSRAFTAPTKYDTSKMLDKIEKSLDSISELRAIVATQPRFSGLGKKKPEIFEIKVDGGTIDEQFKFLVDKLGKEIRVSEVFKPGQYVDVIAVTKGKGFQGPVKRFGVKIAPRWHKHRKGARGHGSRGPIAPGPMFTSPQAGQAGFHQRTEYNKRILKIGLLPTLNILTERKPEDVERIIDDWDINPSGGWPHYGLVINDYVIVQGSIPGPPKRLVKIRFPIRPRKVVHSPEVPQIVYYSTKPILELAG